MILLFRALIIGVLSLINYQKELSPEEKAVSFMSEYGVINDKEAWKSVLESTHNGREIKTTEYLSIILQQVNRHSSALLVNPNQPEMIETKIGLLLKILIILH